MRLQVTISGVSQTARNLQEYNRRLKNLQTPLKLAGEYMLLETDLRFELEVNPSGQPWKPLAPATLQQKRSQGKILKILQRTGFMRSQTGYQILGNNVVIFNKDPKLKYHQLGLGVPKREVMGFSDGNVREINEIFIGYLIRGENTSFIF